MLLNDRPEAFSLAYDARPCEPGDTALVFCGDQVLLYGDEGEGSTRLPRWEDLLNLSLQKKPLHAFTQGNRRVFLTLAEAKELQTLPAGLTLEASRVFRTLTSQTDAFLLSSAYHLATWYRLRKFCGVCGGLTKAAPAERALVCDCCGAVQYPTISPAVIVAITDGDRLLLARNARGVFRHYSLIAGYVEVGETLEQTVQREVMEEVGLRVKDIRYLGNQPWGLSQSQMIGFHAVLDGSPEIVLQESELAEAHWFTKEELPEHAGPSSIAYELIRRFSEGDLEKPL
ncbi:MAG TPA: NAD(+) diphosphatase [Candidatus Limiplasma sp.]|nr:NAD(+) diphosphatase [Candidatus Limiplasma sp.]HPS81542.1 NAD(+) diphosphatase [Candidatus Limiplasma sp.]